MRFGRAAIATGFLIGCTVPLAVPTAAAAAAAQSRSLCAPPADTVGPVVTQVTFGQPSIDLNSGSRVQTVTATASDTSGNGAPSGVTNVRVSIRGNRFGSSPKLELTSGTSESGEWTGQFTVSKYAHPGTYSVYYLIVSDAAGNDQEYPGYSTVPAGPTALSLIPADNPTFEVTGTPATRPHRRAGQLDSFAFSPSSVDTRASAHRVHVTAKFTGAQPTLVELRFGSAVRGKDVHGFYAGVRLKLHHGQWSGALRVPRWIGDQVLAPSMFVVWPSNYEPRYRQFDKDQLHHRGFPTKIAVVSGVDNTKPHLTSLTFEPDPIDSTAGDEQVTVTATATDTHSGVRYVDVNAGIHHGINGTAAGSYPLGDFGIGFLSSDYFHVRLKKTDSGDWVGTTTIKQCVPSGTYKLSASVRDVAGNYNSYSTKELKKVGLPGTIEVTSKHGDVAPPYVYSAATYGADSNVFLNFSEGVANVSTDTLTVYPLSPKDTRFTVPSAVTSIVCANGKMPVDCDGTDANGLVTSAKLTVPDLDPGKEYVVYANLNQITSQLVDGNGNPMNWNRAATEVKDSRSGDAGKH